MKKMSLLAAAVATLGFTGQASATSQILFDQSGAGGPGVLVQAFDWRPGNALARDAIGALPDPDTGLITFTTYFQASLNEFLQLGNPDGVDVLAGREFTVVASIMEVVTFGALGGSLAAFTSIGGTYEIFYDAVANANDNTGLGYNDGLSILRGTINGGGTGVFQNTTINNPSSWPTLADLDSVTSDGNNTPDVKTHNGIGGSELTVNVNYADSNFFRSAITALVVDLEDNSTLKTPFNAANPSKLVGGLAPVYGERDLDGDGIAETVNGDFCGDGVDTCDFHFQSDSNTAFNPTSVPEPGSLAIAGAGLALMSLIRRRKSK